MNKILLLKWKILGRGWLEFNLETTRAELKISFMFSLFLAIIGQFDHFKFYMFIIPIIGHFDQNLTLAHASGQNDQIQIPTWIRLKE